MNVFQAWWTNPVSATLIALATLLLLTWSVVSVVATIRLGAIQLGGLLSHRTALLPRYPRGGGGYVGLVIFQLAGLGAVLALFAVFAVRAANLSGAGNAAGLGLALLGWLLAVAMTLALVRGQRVEAIATLALAALTPWTPLLRRIVRPDEERPEDEEDDDEDDEEIDVHDVKAFIGAGEEAGILEREDAVLVASIVDFSDTIVREILTPRTDVVALPVEADFEAVQKRFAESMFTRIPVFRETLDRIEGVVHVKDVMRAAAAGRAPNAGELLRPVLVVPETKPLRELLREFQAARQQLAIVVDEYGGTSGIVTLEDLIEEIVGEIQDEHQREMPDVQPEADGVFLIKGGAHVEVLEDLFGVEIGEVSFDSVAGLVLDRLGHLPKPGEKAVWRGVELEAVDVDRRRLRRVRVRRSEVSV